MKIGLKKGKRLIYNALFQCRVEEHWEKIEKYENETRKGVIDVNYF